VSLRAFARTWRRTHQGQTTDTTRLVGFCLAVRAAALRSVGGWDEAFETGGAEDDDLCLRLAAAGGRLLICHDSFVHHHGHATFDANGVDWFAVQQANVSRLVAKHGGRQEMRRETSRPLLSACMIVKDEAALLPGCLAAVRGLVDELVVYDTGSSDDTAALARAAGATVVEGDWHDDFARARNAALAYCTGEWVLHVDADEQFVGDPATVRAHLETAPVNAFAVEIVNLGGDGRSDVHHRACRLFRRALFQWRGRLHEQVIHRALGDDYAIDVMDGGRLVHSGYTPEQMAAKRKGERNLRLAVLDANDAERDPVERLVNLGRSYMLANRHDAALALFAQARGQACDSLPLRRVLCRSAAQLCLAIGRADAALAWIEDLQQVSASTDLVRYLRGNAYVAMQRWSEALAAYAGVAEASDEDGTVLPAFVVHRDRARCHFMLEDWSAAAAAAALVAKEPGCDAEVWRMLAESCQRSGRELAPLLSAVPDARLSGIFASLLQLPPATAHPLLEELVDVARYRSSALALAIRLSPAMQIEHAVRWSARLRALGLADHCPLIHQARDERRPAAARWLAAVAARTLFNDDRITAVIQSLGRTMDAAACADLLEQLHGLDRAAVVSCGSDLLENSRQV
jgi:tetratricopeptide (TPR) repeat protein